jgi:uncharacterized protein Ymh
VSKANGLPDHVCAECETHLRNGHLDDAVLTALKWAEKRFVLSAGNPPTFGIRAVERALAQDKGTIRLTSEAERRGTLELVSGLMRLYRNETAHGFPVLSPREARAVVDLTDAILSRIGRGVAHAAAVALGVDASQVIEFASADLDGDGRNETLAAVLTKDAAPLRVVVLKNAEQGYLARTLEEDASFVFAVEARDVDQNGIAEVLIYNGGGGPGTWLDIVRWTPARTEPVQRIEADLGQFRWSQPDGDGAWMLTVEGRGIGRDGRWERERRSFRWGAACLVETECQREPWLEATAPDAN